MTKKQTDELAKSKIQVKYAMKIYKLNQDRMREIEELNEKQRKAFKALQEANELIDKKLALYDEEHKKLLDEFNQEMMTL